jgi:hypothetical protein
MKPELNVNICQITLQDNADDVQWVYIDVEDSRPDDTGSFGRIKLEIPVRLHDSRSRASSDSEAILKAKKLMACAIAGL